MQIVARVIEQEISRRDLDRECAKLGASYEEKSLTQALNRLIDRCLLLVKATQAGFKVSDDEYDNALLELIDEEEPLGLSSSAIQELTAHELETLLKRQLIIKKYIQSLCPVGLPATTEKLKEFYEENKEIFTRPEQVHCAHILIKGLDENSMQKAAEIRSSISDKDDFGHYCKECSDCPSVDTCGDLGWFPKGKMIPEIDSIAFNLKLDEVSEPFKSVYGYHILMLINRREKQIIPFEEIQDSLQARLQQIEREYLITKHVAELRAQYASAIIVYDWN